MKLKIEVHMGMCSDIKLKIKAHIGYVFRHEVNNRYLNIKLIIEVHMGHVFKHQVNNRGTYGKYRSLQHRDCYTYNTCKETVPA